MSSQSSRCVSIAVGAFAYPAIAAVVAIAVTACSPASRGGDDVDRPEPEDAAADTKAQTETEAEGREPADEVEEGDVGDGEGGEAHDLDPIVVEVDPETGEGRFYDPRSLLDSGIEALRGGRPREADAYFGELIEEFPESRLAAPARYNRGLALEEREDYDGAIETYRELAEAEGKGRYAIDAVIRAGAVMAELGRWSQAAEVFEELLARGDLTRSDRVEGHARLGYVLYESRREPEAEEVLREGIELAEEAGSAEPLETTYYVAMSHFYMGMIARRQFSEIPLRLPDDQMERDLETKAELLLLAHERFDRAVDTRHPAWSSAAGYELGAMQEEFWEEIVSAPIPPHLGPEQVEVYRDEVHDHAEEFLERSLNLYRKTVELADAYRTPTRWSRAAEARAERVAELLARERAGERVTPEAEEPEVPGGRPGEADWDAETYIPPRKPL